MKLIPGADIASGPVWMEYITFLKSLPALNAQEESLRMIAVRKVYQRAIVTPVHHIEQLWKDYENFENSVSRQLAKGLISEYQPKFNSARAVYRERKKYIDEIDWNMLAVPPTGSYKAIFCSSVVCLMYLYHYPDIWYEYATWHAKCGSIDSAIKVFQRALKALPDSEMLRYAYAELEESRGAIPSAKKIYESFLGDSANATALAHIQFIRFLRRNEGVEAARKYFLDARKSPNCTYHVYVAYAMMAFCLDKDPKMAHNVFEAGLKRFMHEPVYILEYADFLTRLNDDRNIRALFERALSSLPPEESVEVWKRFIHFEQTYGDLASMLKVEQRRKEALSGTDEEGSSVLESSLQDVVSRYSFMDLWPCSTKDLDHLARQEWLAKHTNKKAEKSTTPGGPGFIDKGTTGLTSNANVTTKVVYPDITQMAIYDPRQKPGTGTLPNTAVPGVPAASNTLSNPITIVTGQATSAFDEILKATPPALLAFLTNLPAIEGPTPNVDVVLSICLQSDIPTAQTGNGKPGTASKQLLSSAAPATSDLSGSTKSHPVPSSSSYKPTKGKRKELDRDDDDTRTVQSQPLPRDAFRIRQFQKARRTASQTGSASYGSAISGDLSGSTS
ncbi:N-terminal acetyltransferase A, auxiliary subunit [Trema orientale]|uniref:N-terminal acetyltransferase A, auxiliary subunit n=1 Tax=Trema orientale TaxID=63057 RepID=A0A2P5EZT9_TREOI|nr:N-terminal acetyltransferase A, auxiliary subunit [Trema orientale]